MDVWSWTQRLMAGANDKRRRAVAVAASAGLPVSPDLALMHMKHDDTAETLRARLLAIVPT